VPGHVCAEQRHRVGRLVVHAQELIRQLVEALYVTCRCWYSIVTLLPNAAIALNNCFSGVRRGIYRGDRRAIDGPCVRRAGDGLHGRARSAKSTGRRGSEDRDRRACSISGWRAEPPRQNDELQITLDRRCPRRTSRRHDERRGTFNRQRFVDFRLDDARGLDRAAFAVRESEVDHNAGRVEQAEVFMFVAG